MAFRAFIARTFTSLAPPLPAAAPPDELRQCAVCRRPFVCPMEWETTGATHWRILTRCGGCGHRCETVITNVQASRLDLELDRDMQEIRRAAGRIDQERMAAQVEAFAAALRHDLIDAADFAR